MHNTFIFAVECLRRAVTILQDYVQQADHIEQKTHVFIRLVSVAKLQGDPKVTPYSKIKMVCF